jgi:hypothetical protein
MDGTVYPDLVRRLRLGAGAKKVTRTPVGLFVYNRPLHTRQTVEALLKNSGAADSDLHVFSDGPKNDPARSGVEEVRKYIRQISGFRSVTIVEHETNRGLARSIIDGVSTLCDKFGSAIVIEDDLVLAPAFLNFMNTALERYRNDSHVMQVSGYMFPVEIGAQTDSFFLPFTTSWGWASWARAWRDFDPEMSAFGALSADRHLRNQFNLGGAYDYFGMLQKQSRGELDSWAIRWYLSVFMKKGLTLYPAHTLVRNIGFDGSGTHCSNEEFGQNPTMPDFEVSTYPESVTVYADWQRVLKGLPGHGTGFRGWINRARTLARRAFRSGSRA